MYGGNGGAGHGKIADDIATNPEGLSCLAISPAVIYGVTVVDGVSYIQVAYNEKVDGLSAISVNVDQKSVTDAVSGHGYLTANTYDAVGNLIKGAGDIMGTRTVVGNKHEGVTQEIAENETMLSLAKSNNLTPLETFDISMKMNLDHTIGAQHVVLRKLHRVHLLNFH